MSRRSARVLLPALAALALASPALSDVYVLTNGDRVTGKTASRGRSFTVQTPYGRLTIPKSRIERILRDDGTEEVLNPPPGPAPTPEPKPPLHLIVVITGRSFWYAWEPKAAPPDATLRLELRLDEETLALYADPRPDPDEIPGALVNAFSFVAEDVVVTPGPEAQLITPEARPGRIALRIELPRERAGRHRLRLAYQLNEGTDSQPAWRDVTDAALDVELKPEAPTFIQVQQDGGQMEFSGFGRRRMKRVDTFRLFPRAE